MLSTFCLKEIAASGGNLIINAKSLNSLSIKEIAAAGHASGASMIIKNAQKLNSISCKEIAKANPGHVTFDYSE